MADREIHGKRAEIMRGECPFCGAPETCTGRIQADGPAAWEDCSCDACGKSWRNDYDYVGSFETA